MIAARTRQNGFMMAELAVGTALIGLIMAGLAVSMEGFARLNHYQWTRQRCVAAAEAQLDSLAATGESIDEAQLKRLWPEVDLVMERTAGSGPRTRPFAFGSPDAPWDGLELVRVTATGRTGARAVAVRLERYMRMDF